MKNTTGVARPLLLRREFAPLFCAQSLGALSANLFRTAALMMIVWRADRWDYDGVSLAG